MATPQKHQNGGDGKFSEDEYSDENDSQYSDYSERDGDRSYRSDDRSYRSGEGSYVSGERSYRSGEGSYRGSERSYRSGEGSYRSRGSRSYRSGDSRSYRSGEDSRSYRSGEDSRSYRSGGSRSYRSGEGSRSYRSDEGSRSYRSGEGSRSYRSGEDSRSYRSGEGSYRSRDRSRSNRSGERSYFSGNGSRSYRSGNHSYRSGDGSRSYRSGDRSYRSEDGSRSFADDRPDSYRSGEGSIGSEKRSFRQENGDRSFNTDNNSVHSSQHSGQKRSYRSQEDSYRSGEDSRSFTDDRPESFRSGNGSFRSNNNSFRREEGDRSFENEDRSFGDSRHSDEHGSYRSGEGSYRSGENSRNFPDEQQASFRGGEGSPEKEGPSSPQKGNESFQGGDNSRLGSPHSRDFSKDEANDSHSIDHDQPKSYNSVKRSTRSMDGTEEKQGDELSFHDGEASFNGSQHSSEHGSYRSDRSGDDSRSFEGDQPDSYHSGSGASRSVKETISPRALKSPSDNRNGSPRKRDEQDSFRSGEDSYRSEDGSGSLAGAESSPLPKDAASPDTPRESPHDDNKSNDEHSQGKSDAQSNGDNSRYSDQESRQESRHSSYSGHSSNSRSQGDGSYHSSDEDEQSFGADDYDEPNHQGSVAKHRADASPVSPTAAFQNSKMSMVSAALSEFDSEAPSFAEDSDFSPVKKSPRVPLNTPSVILENGVFEAQPPIGLEDQGSNDPFGTTAFGGSAFAAGGFDDAGFDDAGFGKEDDDAFFGNKDTNAFSSDLFGSQEAGTETVSSTGGGFDNSADPFAGHTFPGPTGGGPSSDGTSQDTGMDSKESKDSATERLPAAGESSSSFSIAGASKTSAPKQNTSDNFEHNGDDLFGDTGFAAAGASFDNGFAAPDEGFDNSTFDNAFGGNQLDLAEGNTHTATKGNDSGFSNGFEAPGFAAEVDSSKHLHNNPSSKQNGDRNMVSISPGSKSQSDKSQPRSYHSSQGSYHSSNGSSLEEKVQSEEKHSSHSSVHSPQSRISYQSEQGEGEKSSHGSQVSFHSSLGSSVPAPNIGEEHDGSYHSSTDEGEPQPQDSQSYHSSVDEGALEGQDSAGPKSYHSSASFEGNGEALRNADTSFKNSEDVILGRDDVSQSRSVQSGGDSAGSRTNSYNSGESRQASYHSDEGSYHSSEGSNPPDDFSSRSGSDQESLREKDDNSFISGNGSEGTGEASTMDEARNNKSEKSSIISREESSNDDRSQQLQESYRSGESGRSYHSSESGSRSPHSSGHSFAEDDPEQLGESVGDEDSDKVGMTPQEVEPDAPETSDYEEEKIVDDAASQHSEQSMGIGDVFGQPNELFEDNGPAKAEEKSQRSELSQDDTIGDGSKVSARRNGADNGTSGNSPGTADDSQSLQNTNSIDSRSLGAPTGARSPVKEGRARPTPPSSKTRKKDDTEERRRKKKKKRKRRKEAKSQALRDLVTNVNDAMLVLEEKDSVLSETKESNLDTSAHRLLHGFDALLGIFLQLSDELELISTFSKSKKKRDKEELVPVQALKAVLSFAATLDQLFADLKPIILDCFEEEPDEEMDDMLYRLNSLVDLLCETTHRVGEKQEWNERAETTYVTLIELMERETLELISYFEDVDTPDHGLSANIHEAWSATGHIEELRTLQYATDPWLFRQICYEVMVSTDQWCPDTTILMEICGIDPSMLEEEPDPEYLEEDELAPIPQAAEHVLDKVNGEPLPRTITLASILRRILPPRAVTDPTLLDHFTSIRNTIRNPLGLSATNIVSISSVPEQLNDPDALGIGGMGKTTLAAMVAQHPDVRRYYIDGVVWVYVGDKELNYNRYTQCLRELVAQLDFYQGVPLFAELLHVPGEPMSKRRRREEGFMIYARDTIAELLHDRSVLIILDDVCFEPDLDWFDFAPMPGESTNDLDSNCALLVTTRCRTLLPAADTVEVDMLDEADAISLLIQESGQLSHTLMAESREARSVVRECANHPLAVKSVGRWLNMKHATAGVVSSVEEIHSEVIKSMDKILKGGDHTGTDMMYEILSMSLSPAINGEPTNIIKFCLAAFIVVFCDREYISDFALTEPTPIIPMDMAELLFETLLEMNESSLLQKDSMFYSQKKEAAVLIPEALSALGVLKVITYSDADEEENPEDEQKFVQVMHFVHHEYGEFLCTEEEALKDLTKDAERQWNRALVEAYLSQVDEWDTNLQDAGHSYALEMIISHMIRGGMYNAAADLLADKSFVRGRLLSLERENATRRHIKDCETLFKKLKERRPKGSKLEPRTVMKQAYQALGSQLAMDDDEHSMEDSRLKDREVARAHYEIGFSLAEKRCWDAAIAHWETSQELLVSALGTVEIVAGILFNIGVVYSEMNEYEQALDSLKQCLRIRGTIHGEDHILYAQTIQKIGDIFLGMSDYHEAMESYNWALDVMYTEPSYHRVEIGEILDNKGTIHYSKGEVEEALQCHQEALRSKQVDLGEDHPELAVTYQHIGNCLSDHGNVEDATVHFEEAIRLMEIDPEGGPERDAEVLTIEGILHNLEGQQAQGLECYEMSLQILVTKVSHRKEKVASLLHLIGCVYLMSGEQKKAMKLFEESLQARRKVLGFVHLDVASTLFNMAFLHQTRNRLDKALKCLEEALKIRQLRLPDSEKVAVTHEKIGSLARAIGKTKKAQINFEDALRIRRVLHGEQHEAVATVLQELGDLMDDIGEYDSAMSYYIDALDIRRNRLGLDDIAVGETLYSMGYTLHNNDEPDRALVCFEESLSIRRYQLGEDSKEVGDTLNMMGFLKAKRGELDDALTLLWDALRIRKLQEDHVKVSETLKNIGNVHREKQEQELAVECYEECLRIRRAELGPEHEKVADALIAMGNVQSDMGRTDEAMRSYQETLKIRTKVFGEHDESVAAVLQYMGTMEFRAGNHEKARDLLTEFIRIRRDNNAKNDGDYVNVLFMIGNIHKMHGQEEEAQLCWSEAYQVFQELGLAENNPQIAKVMNHLLKVEEEKEVAEQKKKAKGGGMFGNLTGKFKGNLKEEKMPGKKRRKGKGIQL